MHRQNILQWWMDTPFDNLALFSKLTKLLVFVCSIPCQQSDQSSFVGKSNFTPSLNRSKFLVFSFSLGKPALIFLELCFLLLSLSKSSFVSIGRKKHLLLLDLLWTVCHGQPHTFCIKRVWYCHYYCYWFQSFCVKYSKSFDFPSFKIYSNQYQHVIDFPVLWSGNSKRRHCRLLLLPDLLWSLEMKLASFSKLGLLYCRVVYTVSLFTATSEAYVFSTFSYECFLVISHFLFYKISQAFFPTWNFSTFLFSLPLSATSLLQRTKLSRSLFPTQVLLNDTINCLGCFSLLIVSLRYSTDVYMSLGK